MGWLPAEFLDDRSGICDQDVRVPCSSFTHHGLNLPACNLARSLDHFLHTEAVSIAQIVFPAASFFQIFERKNMR